MYARVGRHLFSALLTLSVGMLAACQTQPLVISATQPTKLEMGTDASAHSARMGRGVIVINIRGFLDKLAKDRQVLARVSDVDRVVVSVQLEEGKFSKTITKAGITMGLTTATFTGLMPGPVTVTMEAFNAASALIGSTSAQATVVSNENTVVDLTLQLNPTYVPPGGLGSDLPSSGDLTASGVIVDGEVIEGTPTPTPTSSPTPTPTATATPTPTPTPTATPANSGPLATNTFQIGSQPRAVAVDTAGRAWVAHVAGGTGFPSVSQLSATGSLAMSIAATDGPGNDPSDIAVDSGGNVWIANEGADPADANRGKVSKFTPNGTLIFATTVDVGVKKIVLDAGNNAWVINQRPAGTYQSGGSTMPEAHTVVQISSTGAVLATYAFTTPVNDVALDPAGNVWITHGGSTSGKATKLSTAGQVLGTYALPSGVTPLGIAFDGSGYAWIAGSKGSTLTGDVYRMSASGIIWGTYQVGVNPRDVAIDGSGFVWVANQGSNTVTQLSSTGAPVATYQVGQGPSDLAAGSSGLWVTNGFATSVTNLAP